MNNTLFTASGCVRCKIAKSFLDERGILFDEFDIKGDGKEPFGQFYRKNRKRIIRDKNMLEFPIFTDGQIIRQGVGVILAYLLSGSRLDSFIGRSLLSKGWIDGIHVSGGDTSMGNDLVSLLNFLKKKGLKIQADTNGKNASLLKQLYEKKLCDRMIMDVKGPLEIYGNILGEVIDPDDIKNSMAQVISFPEYQFQTTVAPVIRQEDDGLEINWLTPDDIADVARLVKDVTGGNKHPYILKMFNPETCSDKRLKSIEPLPVNAMFKYRTAARRHLVLTEIEKA